MLERISHHLHSDPSRPAIHVAGRMHSYAELAERVAAIQACLEGLSLQDNSIIGVLAEADFETYAALLAIMFSGHGYLPLLPTAPMQRNADIAREAGIQVLLAADAGRSPALMQLLPSVQAISTAPLASGGFRAQFRPVSSDHFAYLLFTSGSTGVPKGVPINRGNLEAFLEGLVEAGVALTPDDRVLQMFDLTFDFSVMSVFAPLVAGASIYVAANNELRFMSVYRLLEEQRLTCAPMVPSALAFLRPYFDEIRLEDLRVSIFCGEALLADIAAQWAQCTPNAELLNFYGPTEATVFCSRYRWSQQNQKSHNGAVAIGRAMKHCQMTVFDESGRVLGPCQPGEIGLAGAHLTRGYWNDPNKDQQAFFIATVDGQPRRYYRTGDLGFVDADGDFMFQGRVDQQVKVQGFRIELAEVEHHARTCPGVSQAVAVALSLRDGNSELVLFVESYGQDVAQLRGELARRLPHYMLPSSIRDIDKFPLNKNGKIDRPALLGHLTG